MRLSATRAVPGAIPNSSHHCTSRAARICGGCRPSSRLAITDRALRGRSRSSVLLISCICLRSVISAVMPTTMLPAADELGHFEPTGRLTVDARPAPGWREELRRIPSVRNGISVVALYAQTIGLIVLAVWANNPFVWVAVFLLMGRAHAQFAALMHEAAHRLL